MFVGPFINRSGVSLVSVNQSPAIFRRPFLNFTIFIRVCNRWDRNVNATAIRALSALFLIRTRYNARRTNMIVILRIRHAFLEVWRFNRVAARMRRDTIFSTNGNCFLSILSKRVRMRPIIPIVNITIMISFVSLIRKAQEIIRRRRMINVRVFSTTRFLVRALQNVNLKFLYMFAFCLKDPYRDNKQLSMNMSRSTMGHFRRLRFLFFRFLL